MSLEDLRLSPRSIDAIRRHHRGEADCADARRVRELGLRRLDGGRNNSVFSFQHCGATLCLKIYRVDGRQRAGTEWHALSWLWRHGHDFIPQPFHHFADQSQPAVVMEFIGGTWLGKRRLSRTQMESLVEAHQRLYRITPDSSDNQFRPSTGNSRVMVPRVTGGEWGVDPGHGDALAQEAFILWLTWRKGDDPRLLIKPAHEVLSRGDPNLANCCWSRQRLRIVDFEYCGWSDRTFDLADLVEHVQSHGTPDEDWAWFIEQFELSSGEQRRSQTARRLFALYWLMKLWAQKARQPDNRKDQRFVPQLRRAKYLLAGK